MLKRVERKKPIYEGDIPYYPVNLHQTKYNKKYSLLGIIYKVGEENCFSPEGSYMFSQGILEDILKEVKKPLRIGKKLRIKDHKDSKVFR